MSWKATDAAHDLMRNALQPGDCAIDATVGNGHDTVFLAHLVGESGFVFGLDIQTAAREATQRRLEELGLTERVHLDHVGHEQLGTWIPKRRRGKVGGVMVNLGYLPGADDKSVTTTAENTLKALEGAVGLLRPGGLITVVLYRGHEGGQEEADAVHDWASTLDRSRLQSVEYRALNQANFPPYLVAVSRIV